MLRETLSCLFFIGFAYAAEPDAFVEKTAKVTLTSGKVFDNVLTERRDRGAWVTLEGKRWWYPADMIAKVEFHTEVTPQDVLIAKLSAENKKLREDNAVLANAYANVSKIAQDMVDNYKNAMAQARAAKGDAVEANMQADRLKRALAQEQVATERAAIRRDIAVGEAAAARNDAARVQRNTGGTGSSTATANAVNETEVNVFIDNGNTRPMTREESAAAFNARVRQDADNLAKKKASRQDPSTGAGFDWTESKK